MTQAVTWILAVLWEPTQTPIAHVPPLPSEFTSYWDNNGTFPLLTQVCENRKKWNLALACKLMEPTVMAFLRSLSWTEWARLHPTSQYGYSLPSSYFYKDLKLLITLKVYLPFHQICLKSAYVLKTY